MNANQCVSRQNTNTSLPSPASTRNAWDGANNQVFRRHIPYSLRVSLGTQLCPSRVLSCVFATAVRRWQSQRHGDLLPDTMAHPLRVDPGAAQQHIVCLTSPPTIILVSVHVPSWIFRLVVIVSFLVETCRPPVGSDEPRRFATIHLLPFPVAQHENRVGPLAIKAEVCREK